MKSKILNEEISRIKDMMRKINEGMYDSKGNFTGGPDPKEDDYMEDESFGEEVDEHIRNNFPELFDKLDYDISYDTDRHGDERQRIKLTMKDGSELPYEFKDSIENEFNVIADGDDFITVGRSYSGFEPDFD